MNWLKWLERFMFAGTHFFAEGAPAVGSGEGSPSSGAPASGSPSGQPTGDGGQPSGAPASGQPGGSDNIRQLREAYEGIKREMEPWQKLGIKPDQVQHYQTQYQQVFSEIGNIGEQLGYTEQDITEAIQAKGLLPVLDFLRNEAWRAEQADQGNQEVIDERALEEKMNSVAERVLGPIAQRENQRMTDVANSLFERTVHQLAVEAFKKEGLDVAQIPQAEMEFLMSATSEIMKYEEADLRALKMEGKTAGVQKAFQQAMTELDKYYLSRSGRAQQKLQPPRPGQPPVPSQKPKPSLDDIINDPSVLGKQYA